jgi:hypothetical protein
VTLSHKGAHTLSWKPASGVRMPSVDSMAVTGLVCRARGMQGRRGRRRVAGLPRTHRMRVRVQVRGLEAGIHMDACMCGCGCACLHRHTRSTHTGVDGNQTDTVQPTTPYTQQASTSLKAGQAGWPGALGTPVAAKEVQ